MMNIEDARKLANVEFTKYFQPVLDNPKSPAITLQEFEDGVDKLKVKLLETTGYHLDKFYVNPVGGGIWEITAIFKEDKKVTA